MYHVTVTTLLIGLCCQAALAAPEDGNVRTRNATPVRAASVGAATRVSERPIVEGSWTTVDANPARLAPQDSSNGEAASIGCGVVCDFCWFGTPFELDCDPNSEDDGFCDCGCQFPDTLDCGLPTCDPPCQVCHTGTTNENNCPLAWEGDGECDCGCQFPDTLDCFGTPCGTECQFCHFGTVNENNCPLSWAGDGSCDCGCQFSDAGDCGTAGTGPDLIIQDDVVFPVVHTNQGYSLGIDSTVVNQGTAAANAAFDMTWFISLDTDMSATLDLPWAFITLGCCLPTGSPIRAAGPVPWPDFAPFNTPGQTYYMAAMADDTLQVAESNEQNNWGGLWQLTLCEHKGDLSGDFLTKSDDYARLSACLLGPGATKPAFCLCADDDNDTDVDLRDVAAFFAAFDAP